MRNSRRLWSTLLALLPASALVLEAPAALAEESLIETVGDWIVECGKTEAGGRECQLRNDEDGKPALEQDALLSFTLHDGRNEVDGLVRVADVELPPRLEVEIALGGEAMTVEGVGRRGRLAVRFALQKQALAGLAQGDAARVRFVDQQGQPHEIMFSLSGFDEAQAIAAGYL